MRDSDRIEALWARELDGELTALEREELERALRFAPDLRARRAAWARTRAAISSATSPPALHTARLSAQLAKRKRTRSVAPGGRWAVAVAILGITAVAWWAKEGAPAERNRVARGEHRAPSNAPVRVDVHESEPSPTDDTPAITIQF